MNSTGTAMDYPTPTPEVDGSAIPSSLRMTGDADAAAARLPGVMLPLLARSSALLSLLLQDGAVDLELASSVVALDPGLAFGTLQLANREREGAPIWRFPLAVVAAGRDLMLHFVGQAPQVESCLPHTLRSQLGQLYQRALQRAGVAQFLGRELGNCDPRKPFLAGLLLEVPAMVKLALPRRSISPAALLASLCSTLPSAVVTAAMAGPASADQYDPLTPVGALARIADGVLDGAGGDSAAAFSLPKLAAGPLWRFWSETDMRQRCFLLTHGRELGSWVAANWHKLDPWEFIIRLERHKAQE